MIKKIIAVASGKGGVGKSTLSVNLAVSLANTKNLKIGLLDADVYGPSIPKMLGISEKPSSSEKKQILPYSKFNIKSMSIGNMVPDDKAIIWRGAMASGAIRQLLGDVEWGELDILIIDLPPGTGDIQLSLCQNIKINGAVIVSTPQEVSLIDVRKAINMFKKVNVPILGMVQNMSYLLIFPEIPVSGDNGKPITFDKNSKILNIFEEICNNLINSIQDKSLSDVKINN